MALEGRLADMSLVDLIQVFGMGSKTGQLTLKQSETSSGTLWIADGSITNAVVTDLKRYFHISGEQAVIELMQWEDADFAFTPPAAGESYEKIISASNESLVLQGMRRREQGKVPTIYPHLSLDTNIRLVAELDDSDLSHLTAEEARLLDYMKTHRYATVREVSDGNYYSVEKVFALISRLIALRLVEIDSNNTIPARMLRAEKIMPTYQKDFLAVPQPAPQPVLVAAGDVGNHPSASSPFTATPSIATLLSDSGSYSVPTYTQSPFHPPLQLEPAMQPAAVGLRGLLRSIKNRLLRSA